jgi:hypothetical protein
MHLEVRIEPTTHRIAGSCSPITSTIPTSPTQTRARSRIAASVARAVMLDSPPTPQCARSRVAASVGRAVRDSPRSRVYPSCASTNHSASRAVARLFSWQHVPLHCLTGRVRLCPGLVRLPVATCALSCPLAFSWPRVPPLVGEFLPLAACDFSQPQAHCVCLFLLRAIPR